MLSSPQETVGTIAALLTTCSFFPQIYRSWKIRSTVSLSWNMLMLSITAASFWICYGILLKDPIIILSNAIMGSLKLSLVLLKWKNQYESNSLLGNHHFTSLKSKWFNLTRNRIDL
jgi:MtN3 and saliva related transmembrane protein